MMDKEKSEISIKILYLGLHNQLTKKFGKNKTVSRKDFFTKLGKHYMVPKNLRHLVIKEMEEMKLLKLVSRDSIKILACDINIERDSSKLCKLAGLFFICN